MRPLILTGSLGHGGAEHHAITLANRLAERGHDCYLAYVKPESDQLARIHLPIAGATFSLAAERYLDFAAVRRLSTELARIQPSVLLAANPYALMYATLARARSRLRTPLVLIYHSTRTPGLKQQAQLLAYRPAIWAADCTVFVCEYQRRYCSRRAVLSRRNIVIHNGVDTDHFRDSWSADERRSLRTALGYREEDYVIAMAAALRPEKNHVQLVEAVARLRGAGCPAKALMIGDGPERAQVEARARALGVEGDVTVTGFREDVRPYLAACDVTCVCSLTEALSLAAIEAMAMGRPLVHSQVGGAGELIEAGSNGLLFPAGDTGALVECLSRLSDRGTRLAMGRRARVKAQSAFGEDAMIDRYEQLLVGMHNAVRSRNVRPASTATSTVRQPVALLLGPRGDAQSGISAHLGLLRTSRLGEDFRLIHFAAGSEGRDESAIGRALRLIASPFRLAATVLAHRAAIVHIHTALSARACGRDLAHALIAKLCGARLVYQVHGGPSPEAFCRGSPLFAAVVRSTLRLSDAIVAMSGSEREYFSRFVDPTRVLAFPNAIDCAPYTRLSRRGSSRQEPLRLLYIGPLAGGKGLYELLEALSLARARGIETILVIAGAGPQETALRKLAAAQGSTHVHFVGPVHGATRLSVLEHADVFVLPSYAEGLPYALLESMAAGLPAIATRVGAIPDLIDDGVDGILIEPRSAAALAGAICRLSGDRDALERMGAAARATITARYSIDRLALELRGVYVDLCARAAKQRIARV